MFNDVENRFQTSLHGLNNSLQVNYTICRKTQLKLQHHIDGFLPHTPPCTRSRMSILTVTSFECQSAANLEHLV